MTPLPTSPVDTTLVARARALELLGAYTAEVGHDERTRTLERVVGEIRTEPAAALALVHAMTEYAATFADVAAAASSGHQGVVHPSTLVHALARMEL